MPLQHLLLKLRNSRAKLTALVGDRKLPQYAPEEKRLQDFNAHLKKSRAELEARPKKSFFNDIVWFRFKLRKWRRQWRGEFKFDEERKNFGAKAGAGRQQLSASLNAVRALAEQKQRDYEKRYAAAEQQISGQFAGARAIHAEFSAYFRNAAKMEKGFWANIQEDEMQLWIWPFVVMLGLFLIFGLLGVIWFEAVGAILLAAISWIWAAYVSLLAWRWFSAKLFHAWRKSRAAMLLRKIRGKYTPEEIRNKAAAVKKTSFALSTWPRSLRT